MNLVELVIYIGKRILVIPQVKRYAPLVAVLLLAANTVFHGGPLGAWAAFLQGQWGLNVDETVAWSAAVLGWTALYGVSLKLWSLFQRWRGKNPAMTRRSIFKSEQQQVVYISTYEKLRISGRPWQEADRVALERALKVG